MTSSLPDQRTIAIAPLVVKKGAKVWKSTLDYKTGQEVGVRASNDEVIKAVYLGKERIRGIHRVQVRRPHPTKTGYKTVVWYLPEARFIV